MKLRNKKTGEIAKLIEFSETGLTLRYEETGVIVFVDSFAKIGEEWEDYEEPKEYYYYIGDLGVVSIDRMQSSTIVMHKNFGNYFETKEEAEQAVEKLKAWKRLKDRGFRFTLTPGVGSLDVDPGKFQIEINADMPAKWFCCDAVQEDLDDCFGGEE